MGQYKCGTFSPICEETFQNTTTQKQADRCWSALKNEKKIIIVMLETYLKFDPRAFWIAFLPSDSESARQFVFFYFDNFLQHNRIQYFYTQTTGCRTDKSYFFKRSTTIALSVDSHKHTRIPPFCSTHSTQFTYTHTPTRK